MDLRIYSGLDISDRLYTVPALCLLCQDMLGIHCDPN